MFLLHLLLNLSKKVVFPLPIYGWRLISCSVWYYFWIRNAGSRRSNQSCKLTPVLIHESRSKIKHTHHFFSMYWKQEDADWVHQFRNLRRIEIRELQLHKISFTMQNRATTRTGFCCESLTFVLNKTEPDTTWIVNSE